MIWPLFPKLEKPDYGAWERHFPSGIGGSAFSSPGFQRMMFYEYGQGWRLRLLRVTDGSQDLSLPVFARLNRNLRYDLAVFPIAYYVIPIELDVVTTETVTRVLDEVDRMGVSTFVWWLPPWTTWCAGDFDAGRYAGRLKIGMGETYAIRCDMSYEDHMAQRVWKTHRYKVNTSLSRGLEIIESPSPDLINEYYELYSRVYNEQGWLGPAFSRQFFHDAARSLGLGGKLYIMRLNDRVVGGGVLLIDRHAVHYFQGTVDRAVKDVFPHAVLYSEALKYAYDHRLPYVNLGGVNPGNNSLIDFKKSWGAEPMGVPGLTWRCSVAEAGRMALRKLRVRAS